MLGPELGPGPRQVITDALDELGIEVLLGHRLAEVADRGVMFADGTTLDVATVIWTAGMVANPLTSADLLGLPQQACDSGPYITCLDLGPAGAVLTTGWDRELRLTGDPAKALKKANRRVLHLSTRQ